jgi:hypothetical protein
MYLTKGELAARLGVRRDQVDDLVRDNVIEGVNEANLYDGDNPLTAALLASSPEERRAAGVPDNRGINQRKMRLNMADKRQE